MEEEIQEAVKSPDQEIEEGKAAALLAYVPFMCFVPLLKMRNNRFAYRHGKQGLVLFLIEVAAAIFYIPFISRNFWSFVLILALGLSFYGVLQVMQGKEWKVPFLGDWADKINL